MSIGRLRLSVRTHGSQPWKRGSTPLGGILSRFGLHPSGDHPQGGKSRWGYISPEHANSHGPLFFPKENPTCIEQVGVREQERGGCQCGCNGQKGRVSGHKVRLTKERERNGLVSVSEIGSGLLTAMIVFRGSCPRLRRLQRLFFSASVTQQPQGECS